MLVLSGSTQMNVFPCAYNPQWKICWYSRFLKNHTENTFSISYKVELSYSSPIIAPWHGKVLWQRECDITTDHRVASWLNRSFTGNGQTVLGREKGLEGTKTLLPEGWEASLRMHSWHSFLGSLYQGSLVSPPSLLPELTVGPPALFSLPAAMGKKHVAGPTGPEEYPVTHITE